MFCPGWPLQLSTHSHLPDFKGVLRRLVLHQAKRGGVHQALDAVEEGHKDAGRRRARDSAVRACARDGVLHK